MYAAESCSEKFYEGKKINYRWNEIAWVVLHKAGIYGLSWILLKTIAFENSF